jgi:hexosaminidase
MGLSGQRTRRLLVALAVIALAGGASTALDANAATTAPTTALATAAAATSASMANSIVPEPAVVQPSSAKYQLTSSTMIFTQAGSADAAAVGTQLATLLRPSTGLALTTASSAARPQTGNTGIALLLTTSNPGLGAEGYTLDVTNNSIVITAAAPAGLFYGVQTLRQLLPAKADAKTTQQGVTWSVPGGHISDTPRFPYRGAMLDVSRHFFGVPIVERLIDEISAYKVNYLHLHLSDDQGWRIVIDKWPNLAIHGGSTEVGGGAGGYYTEAQYEQIVAYAKAHFVTIVPEIDGPGHTNAALSSYAQLNCNGVAPPLYTGTDVGFSTLCVNSAVTYQFEQDVLNELAALTPGPFLHIGGDEAQSTTATDYATFEDKDLALVAATGKRAIGWHDVTQVNPPTSFVAQFWGTTTTDPTVAAAAARGNKVIMSPAVKAYLDMKYTEATKLGQDWAALIEVKDAYNWDPGNYLQGVTGNSVLGVEGPIWSETLLNMANIEYLAFPRLPALAELGWSPESTHNWNSFSVRLGNQGPRWTVEGINFYASPQVPWAPGTVGGVD